MFPSVSIDALLARSKIPKGVKWNTILDAAPNSLYAKVTFCHPGYVHSSPSRPNKFLLSPTASRWPSEAKRI